jgi:hypothetical protein
MSMSVDHSCFEEFNLPADPVNTVGILFVPFVPLWLK